MIDYCIQTISFIGLKIINGVIGMESERPLPVDGSNKWSLSYDTEELWHLETKNNKNFL